MKQQKIKQNENKYLKTRFDSIEKISDSSELVFRLRHKALSDYWILKILNNKDNNLERFTIEAKILYRIRHPHVVSFFDFDYLPTGRPFILMEYVDGPTLLEIIQKQPLLPETKIVKYMIQTAEALKNIHHYNIVHRDIKPSNILIDIQSDNVKVADFGIALAKNIFTEITEGKYRMGTYRYMSPEQFEDSNNVNYLSDIYNFGATYYHITTGHFPLSYSGIPLKYGEILKNEIPRSPNHYRADLSSGLSKLLLKCLEKKATDRGNFEQILSELQQIKIDISLGNISNGPYISGVRNIETEEDDTEPYELKQEEISIAMNNDYIKEIKQKSTVAIIQSPLKSNDREKSIEQVENSNDEKEIYFYPEKIKKSKKIVTEGILSGSEEVKFEKIPVSMKHDRINEIKLNCKDENTNVKNPEENILKASFDSIESNRKKRVENQIYFYPERMNESTAIASEGNSFGFEEFKLNEISVSLNSDLISEIKSISKEKKTNINITNTSKESNPKNETNTKSERKINSEKQIHYYPERINN